MSEPTFEQFVKMIVDLKKKGMPDCVIVPLNKFDTPEQAKMFFEYVQNPDAFEVTND